MPAAVKLQKEFGDRIQVIFVESQGTGHEKSVGFALKAGWLGNQAIWTSQRPFSVASRGLPSFALINPNGEVVLTGYSNRMHSQIVEELERMVRKPDYGDMPKSIQKIYKELNKKEIGDAYDLAEKVIAKPGSKDTELILTAAQNALEAVKGRFENEINRIKWLLENGYPEQALELSKELVKNVKKNDSMLEEAKTWVEKIEGKEFKELLKLDKELTKIEQSIYQSKEADPRSIKKLEDFVNENPDSSVTKRAEEIINVAKFAQ